MSVKKHCEVTGGGEVTGDVVILFNKHTSQGRVIQDRFIGVLRAEIAKYNDRHGDTRSDTHHGIHGDMAYSLHIRDEYGNIPVVLNYDTIDDPRLPKLEDAGDEDVLNRGTLLHDLTASLWNLLYRGDEIHKLLNRVYRNIGRETLIMASAIRNKEAELRNNGADQRNSADKNDYNIFNALTTFTQQYGQCMLEADQTVKKNRSPYKSGLLRDLSCFYDSCLAFHCGLKELGEHINLDFLGSLGTNISHPIFLSHTSL